MPVDTGQVTISSSPTKICNYRSGRTSITIETQGSTTVYIGNQAVAVGDGIRLKGIDGASICLNAAQGELYGIADGTDQVVSYIEVWPK